MDNEERREGRILPENRDSRINVVINRSDTDGDSEIDLVGVFRKMKRKFRVFAWVILLCFALGICAPLVLYQFNRTPLTVSSVVTLKYYVVTRNAAGRIVSSAPVTDLSAPDGEALDLNQITSSYVLQAALEGLELSHPLSLVNLRNNIRIDRILTEDSRRQQEVASRMMADKNDGAYEQVQSIELTYENRFVVSLANGFGSVDSRKKSELTDAELRLVLDRILSAYNDYLVAAYADVKLPDNELSAINIGKQDILESLDLMSTAMQNLYDFCNEKPVEIKEYRSWRNGSTLGDLMSELAMARTVNVDYLYSCISTNSIVKDRDSLITNYQYQLRNTQNELDALNESIATTQDILDNYKNDEIYVSMQESDTTKSTKMTTDYYNQLILEQADNYEKAAKLETRIASLEFKLASLNTASGENTALISQEEAAEELAAAMEVCRKVYTQIVDQLKEIHASAFFTTFAEHSAAQGKTASFLSATAKKMVIGGLAGLVVACGLWFLSALALELRSRRADGSGGKEATEA